MEWKERMWRQWTDPDLWIARVVAFIGGIVSWELWIEGLF